MWRALLYLSMIFVVGVSVVVSVVVYLAVTDSEDDDEDAPYEDEGWR